MRLINVKVPDNIIREIKAIEKDESDIAKILETGIHQIKIEHSLSLFKRGDISIWNAAKMAGVPLREMIVQASAYGIKPKFDEKMIEEETA